MDREENEKIMRKVDIERSRDFYKELQKTTMNCFVEATRCYEETEKYFRTRIKELEGKLNENKHSVS